MFNLEESKKLVLQKIIPDACTNIAESTSLIDFQRQLIGMIVHVSKAADFESTIFTGNENQKDKLLISDLSNCLTKMSQLKMTIAESIDDLSVCESFSYEGATKLEDI